MKKKFMALTLVLLFILQSFCVTVNAESTVNTPTLIANEESKYEALLNALGIFEEGIDKTVSITRGEAAGYLVKFLNEGDNLLSYRGVFSDVSASEKNALEIEKLADLGIIRGDGNYCFRPTDYLTYNEAIYLFGCVIGYGAVSDFNHNAASYVKRHGIMNNVKAVFDYVNVSDLMIMMYNALHSTVLEQNVYGSNGSYTESKENLLYKNFDILYANGTVVKNDLTYLWTAQGINNDDVELDCGNGERLLINTNGKSVLRDCLGKYIKVYYKAEKNVDSYDYVLHDVSPANKIINIGLEQVDLSNSDIGNRKLTYYIGDKETNIIFSEDFYIIYNNAAYKSNEIELASFLNKVGKLELIDNNYDSAYDVLKINVYDSIIVGSVSLNYNTICDKYDSSKIINIDEDKYNGIFVYNEAGEEITLDEIEVDDVISVAKSSTFGELNNFIEIRVSKSYLSGEITKYKKDTYAPTIIINENDNYPLADRATSMTADFYKIGKRFIGFLDVFGNIVYITDDYGRDMQYGVIVKMGNNVKGLYNDVRVKMVTLAGTIEEFKIAESVLIDGKKYDNLPAEVHSKLSEAKLTIDGLSLPSGIIVVKYRIDNKGEIKVIDTENPVKGGYTDILEKMCGGKVVVNSDMVIGWEHPFDENTTVLTFVSDDYSDDSSFDENLNVIIGTGKNSIKTSKEHHLAAYKCNPDSPYADFVVRFEKNEIEYDEALFVIDEVIEAYDEKKETNIYQICGYLAGVYKELRMSKIGAYKEKKGSVKTLSTELISAQKGDVIRCLLSADNTILSYEYIIKNGNNMELCDINKNTATPRVDATDSMNIILGYVKERKGVFVKMNQLSAGIVPVINNKEYWNGKFIYAISTLKSIPLVIVDKQMEKVFVGTAEDILDYSSYGAKCSKILVRYRSNIPKDIVIFN